MKMVTCLNKDCENWKENIFHPEPWAGKCILMPCICINDVGSCANFRKKDDANPKYHPLDETWDNRLEATCPEAEIMVHYPDHTETITFGDLVDLVAERRLHKK